MSEKEINTVETMVMFVMPSGAREVLNPRQENSLAEETLRRELVWR